MKNKLNKSALISILILLLSSVILSQDLLRNQSSVNLYFSPNQIELGIDSVAWVELRVDAVENVFSAAGEFVYEPSKIKILEVLEGNLLNQDGGQTTFLQTNNQANGRVYFGITRLGAQNGGVTSTEPKTVIKIRIIQGIMILLLTDQPHKIFERAYRLRKKCIERYSRAAVAQQLLSAVAGC